MLFGWRIVLLVFPFRWARARISTPPSSLPAAAPAASAAVSRIGWAVSAAARHVPGAGGCLVQALAAERLLRVHGLSACLRIGVASDGGKKLRAHAWVESGGRVVIGGRRLSGYTPLAASGVRAP